MTNLFDNARSLASLGLTGVAKVLRTAAGAAGGIATLLKPPAESETTRRRSHDEEPVGYDDELGVEIEDGRAEPWVEGEGAEAEELWAEDWAEDEWAQDESAVAEAESAEAPTAEEPAADAPPADEVPGDDAARAAVAPTHIAELAQGTVDEIKRAIEGMSTDELRLLHEHESTHRGRKRVLDAVERALTP